MALTSKPATDAFTLEIIKARLAAVAEEMFIAQGRTSKSPIIYEVLDYATALTDRRGRLVAQANGVAGFLGALTYPVQDTLAKYGLEGLQPGDIVATNIPYEGGGSHLSDVSMAMPVFYQGHVVAFAANKAHWTEVGGKDPGSMTNDATEIFQEGVQLPCIKLYEGGRPLPALLDFLAANVRTPDSTLADLYAQAAALRLAQRRLEETCAQYGPDAVEAAIESLLAEGERRARLALAQLPKGTFTAEDEVEDDGLGTGPTVARVRVTISADSFTADFTGTGPQTLHSSTNCTRVALMAAMRIMFTAIACPQYPVNEGVFAPLRVICPDGTIFTAQRPAPTSTYWEARLVASDLVWKALAPAVPERLTAGHFLSVCPETLRTRHPETGEMALLVEPNAGGWGAACDRDGEDALYCLGDGETYVLSTEVAETRYNVRVQRYGFDIVPGGEGQFRGGRGLVREFLVLDDTASLTATFGRSVRGAWAVADGRPGTPNYVEVRFADGRPPLRSGKPTRVPLRRDDLVRLVTGTGGGWGDPRRRPPEMVLQDLRQGTITPDVAREIYGVEVHQRA